jgi:predicted negative regulator of RcsB-dependent stress response
MKLLLNLILFTFLLCSCNNTAELYELKTKGDIALQSNNVSDALKYYNEALLLSDNDNDYEYLHLKIGESLNQ